MELNIKQIKNAVNVASNFALPENLITPANCFLFEFTNNTLNLHSTNFIEYCIASLPIETQEENFCINANLFTKFIRSIDAEIVHLEKKDNKVYIYNGAGEYSFDIIAPNEFPIREIPNSKNVNTYNIIPDIKRISFTCAKDSSRPAMQGVFLSDDIVATNGHVLSYTPNENNTNGIIIPKALIDKIAKFENYFDSYYVNKNDIIFKFKNDIEFTIISKLIDGTFPNYKAVIPTLNYKISLDKEYLLKLLNKIKVFTKFKLNVKIENNLLYLIVKGENKSAKETIAVETPQNHSFAIDIHYLISAINATKDEQITIEYMNNKLKPIIIKDSTIQTIIMPIKDDD